MRFMMDISLLKIGSGILHIRVLLLFLELVNIDAFHSKLFQTEFVEKLQDFIFVNCRFYSILLPSLEKHFVVLLLMSFLYLFEEIYLCFVVFVSDCNFLSIFLSLLFSDFSNLICFFYGAIRVS